MASVRKIASDAGVSIATVSRVLNDEESVRKETRLLVLSVAEQNGYVQQVGRRSIDQIALLYTQEMTLTHPFDASVLDGIVRGVSDLRFDLVILGPRHDKRPTESYPRYFHRKGIRGVIIRTMHPTRKICEDIAESGFPHVVISERFDLPKVCCIDCDSCEDSVRAVEYLIDLGHRRIAFATHNVPDRDHGDRYEGYCRALNNHGIPVEDKLIFRHPFTLSGGATALTMAMSIPDPPTAIFLANPMLAIGAMKQARELGVRIPDDLSLIGFDDTNLRFSVFPTMTAVCQDSHKLGLEAAKWLSKEIREPSGELLRKQIPTFFEVNQTTAAPRTRRIKQILGSPSAAIEQLSKGDPLSANVVRPANGEKQRQ